jgi:hypothetical protein
MSDQRHHVQADHSERDAPLLELLRQARDFDVRMARLTVGDYRMIRCASFVFWQRKSMLVANACFADTRGSKVYPAWVRRSPHAC